MNISIKKMQKKNKVKDTSLKTAPGSLKYVGKLVDHSINIKIVEYNSDLFEEKIIEKDFANIKIDNSNYLKTWLNIDGIHQPGVIQEIGNIFNLHPLVLEDIMNTNQKPKYDYYGDDILFFTMKAIEYNSNTKSIEVEHVSLVLGHNFLITFQEEGNIDIFSEINDRLKSGIGKVRKYNVDYLFFQMVDIMIDNYLEVIQKIDEDLDVLENSIINNPHSNSQNLLYSHKREINLMRKFTMPVREMLNSIVLFNENNLFHKNTKLYLRDAQDHAQQVVEMLDTNREMIAGLMDLYFSQMSNKMNNIIKVLTIISVIFMPLTFLVGVYGMNFDFMPELRWKYGYYSVWVLSIIITVVLLVFFRKKRWI